jgi:hypothetical protein
MSHLTMRAGDSESRPHTPRLYRGVHAEESGKCNDRDTEANYTAAAGN